MSCEHCQDALMELEPSEWSTLDHLQSCEACQAFADEIRSMDAAMADEVDAFADAGSFEDDWASAKIQAAEAAGPANRGRWFSIGALATLAAAAAILFVVIPEVALKPPISPDPIAAPAVAPVEVAPTPAAEPEPPPAAATPRPSPRPRARPAPSPRPAAAPPPPAAEPEQVGEPEESTASEPTPSADPVAKAPGGELLQVTVSGGPATLKVSCPSGFRSSEVANEHVSLDGLPPERCDLTVDGQAVGKVEAGRSYTLVKVGDRWRLKPN